MQKRMRAIVISLALVLVYLAPSLVQEHTQASGDGLFSTYAPVELTLTAPFSELFPKASTNTGEAMKGTLSYVDPASNQPVTIDNVMVSTRGHTSAREDECTFPKLKLTFGGQPQGSMFRDTGAIKIGTHCGERADAELSSQYGRWGNEKAPQREVAVYRLLEAMDIPALKARPARMTYVDSGARSQAPLVRNAMLLEDDSSALKRLGATRQYDEKTFGAARGTFTDLDTAKLALAEAMTGNFDWCLRFYPGDTYRCDSRHPLWNVMALVGPDGKAFPVLHDFDLAGMVVGRHPWFNDVFNEAAGATQLEVEVVSQVQRTRSLFPRAVLDAARRSLAGRKAAAYQALREADVDSEGRATIESYLKSFFAAIETDAAFYRPVVVSAQTRAFTQADPQQPVCGDGSIPPGTPVSKPIEENGDKSLVTVIDALWHWATKKECAAGRKAVWIPTSAIGTEYPKY